MRRHHRARGVTLIEMMIVVTVILTLGGIAAAGYSRAMMTVMEVKCMNNLKTMARALETYRMTNLAYPPGYPEPDLKQLLAKHVDDVEASFIFECPIQPDEPIDRMRNVIGYDEFYIERKLQDNSGIFNFVINCPHHGTDTLTLLYDGSVDRAISAPVYHSVSGYLYPGQIAVGGQISFADGVTVDFEGQQCANYIMSYERAVGSEGLESSCDETMRLLPGEIGDFQVEVKHGRKLCVMTCVADIRAIGEKEPKDGVDDAQADEKKPKGLVVDFWTYYGTQGGDTPRSGPYTLCIMPVAGTYGRVEIRQAPETRIQGPNPVNPGEVTYVIDDFSNPQMGGRCTPPVPID